MMAGIGVYEDAEAEDTCFIFCCLCTVCCQEATESFEMISFVRTKTNRGRWGVNGPGCTMKAWNSFLMTSFMSPHAKKSVAGVPQP